MNSDTHYPAIHIISTEISHEIAKNCKLRSKYMHEKIQESKNKTSGKSVVLALLNDNLDVLLTENNMLIMSYPIIKITYSACDKSTCLFAFVSKSIATSDLSHNGSSSSSNYFHCHIFKMFTYDQADAINRHFGTIFKNLQQKKRARKSESNSVSSSNNKQSSNDNLVGHESHQQTSQNKPGSSTNMSDNKPVRRRQLLNNSTNSVQNSKEDLEKKLRRISSPMIEELVAEKNARRLSLCMMSPVEDCLEIASLSLSLEKKNKDASTPNKSTNSRGQSPINNNNNNIQSTNAKSSMFPVRKRRSTEEKFALVRGNRISAVFERLSFRGSRDVSIDGFKNGSPVVALKEKIESGSFEECEEYSYKSKPTMEYCQYGVSESNRSQRYPSGKSIVEEEELTSQSQLSYDDIGSNSNTRSSLSRNQLRSAPQLNHIQLITSTDLAAIDDQLINSEIAPVPPVRINSLRQTASFSINQSSLANKHGLAPIATTLENEVSPITTPSTSDQEDNDNEINNSSNYQNKNNANKFIVHNNQMSHSHGKLKAMKSINSHNPSNIPLQPLTCASYFQNNNTNIMSNSNCNNSSITNISPYYFKHFSKDDATNYLIEREVGSFLVRDSGSQPGCLALSVRVSMGAVSHYIIQWGGQPPAFRIRGLPSKSWPSLPSLLTHLTVLPELLPCPLRPNTNQNVNRSNVNEQYQQNMPPDQYQQLSEFSSMVASLDIA